MSMEEIGLTSTFPIQVLPAARRSPVDRSRVFVNGLDSYRHVNGVIYTFQPFVIEALVI